MADLLVRGIDEDLVRALKERAGAHGRSAEAEHREILAAVRARPRRRSFAEVLASMPEVGADADFDRAGERLMYLVDTNVISETRKRARANPGASSSSSRSLPRTSRSIWQWFGG